MTLLLGRDLCLAPGVEWRPLGDEVVLLRAPDGRGHVAVSRKEAAALTKAGPAVPIEPELRRHLENQGLLADSPPPARRRVVVTSAGLEFDCLSGLVAAAARPARAVSRSPILWGGVVVLAVAGFACTMAAALGPVPSASPRVAALVVALLSLVTGLFHELGHAVVIAVNGRRVGRLGVGFYFGAPSVYVDSTDAVFMNRGARIAQAAAGVFAEMVLACPVILIALLLDPWAPGAARTFALLTVTSGLVNLTPLLKLDGYWALTDLLRRPLLAEDTKAAFRHLIQRRPADRRLLAYGGLCSTFGLALVMASFATWWNLRGPILAGLWRGDLIDRAIAVFVALPVGIGILGGILAVVSRRSASAKGSHQADRGETTSPSSQSQMS